jgi:hypothetical protein
VHEQAVFFLVLGANVVVVVDVEGVIVKEQVHWAGTGIGAAAGVEAGAGTEAWAWGEVIAEIAELVMVDVTVELVMVDDGGVVEVVVVFLVGIDDFVVGPSQSNEFISVFVSWVE